MWHNYGFDRHVIENEGIYPKGFGGDTMHMARLWDTSRDRASGGGGTGYSLESLADELIDDERFTKTSMKELFGIARTRKDGTPSKIKEIPPMEHLQTSPDSRDLWIQYSSKDAIATWWVYASLEQKLRMMPWVVDGGSKLGHLFEFYWQYLRRFGELLTDMEAEGIKVDTAGHLKKAEGLTSFLKTNLKKALQDIQLGKLISVEKQTTTN